MIRHDRLHDIGGVGAEHHELAMGHIDDPHRSVNDRQPDRCDQPNTGDAQTEDQRIHDRREFDVGHDASAMIS